jgi:hypothetical protein
LGIRNSQSCVPITTALDFPPLENHYFAQSFSIQPLKTDKMIEIVDDLFQYHKAKEAIELSYILQYPGTGQTSA